MTVTKMRHYWGIKEGDKLLFQGTHEECWKKLSQLFPLSTTIKDLIVRGIKISRIK